MRRPTVHLVAARGGHLELLQRIRAAFDGYERVWVTERSPRADALAAEGETVRHLPHYGRSPALAARNLRAAARIIHAERPELIVCSGSGVTVPFCLMARAAGAELIFAETMARVTGASMSGRVLSRLAGHTFVQWPEMAAVYPGAEVCRPALLEHIGRFPEAGRGTFVGVGTWFQPFDRLLRMVDEAAGQGILPGPVRAQSGVSSYEPEHFHAEATLEPEALEEAIAGSEVVVCHAGSGILSTALRHGRRPLVLPRLRSAGEHVDDHQVQIAGKLAEYGLATRLSDAIRADDVAGVSRPLPPLPASAGRVLAEALRERLASRAPLPALA